MDFYKIKLDDGQLAVINKSHILRLEPIEGNDFTKGALIYMAGGPVNPNPNSNCLVVEAGVANELIEALLSK